MKVLITGGCGFLGSNLAAYYLERKAEVVLVDALYRRGGEDNLRWLRNCAAPAQLHFHQVDLSDGDAMETVFRVRGPFDYVCHVGGQVAMTSSLQDPKRDLLTNVVGTFNVLDCVRRFSPNAFVAYSSTNKVYGDLLHLTYIETGKRYIVPEFPDGFAENLPLDFATPYGCSKGAADQYVRDWSRTYGVQTVVFRHSSIYGGRQFASVDQGWVGWFCDRALNQQREISMSGPVTPFTIAGNGKQVRDVLHATDLVTLYHAAYEARESISGKIFNIGGGMANSLSLLELFSLLEEILGLSSPLVVSQTPRRHSDQNVFVADVRSINASLGWLPSVSFRVGISQMIEWLTSCRQRS